MNPQQTNLQYHRCETYTDQKMVKKTWPTFIAQRGFTGNITPIFYQCRIAGNSMRGEKNRSHQSVGRNPNNFLLQSAMMDENNTRSNAWRPKLVLYVDGKNRITDRKLALERGGEPPHNGW